MGTIESKHRGETSDADRGVERVSSRQFHDRIGYYQDMALQRPVIITSHGRDRVAMISVEEYQRLRKRDRQVMRTTDLNEADLEAIGEARVPPGHEHLDVELED